MAVVFKDTQWVVTSGDSRWIIPMDRDTLLAIYNVTTSFGSMRLNDDILYLFGDDILESRLFKIGHFSVDIGMSDLIIYIQKAYKRLYGVDIPYTEPVVERHKGAIWCNIGKNARTITLNIPMAKTLELTDKGIKVNGRLVRIKYNRHFFYEVGKGRGFYTANAICAIIRYLAVEANNPDPDKFADDFMKDRRWDC